METDLRVELTSTGIEFYNTTDKPITIDRIGIRLNDTEIKMLCCSPDSIWAKIIVQSGKSVCVLGIRLTSLRLNENPPESAEIGPFYYLGDGVQ